MRTKQDISLTPKSSLDLLTILSRIAIASPDLLVSAYEVAQPGKPIDWLFDEWLDHVDDISHPERKKLVCLALTSCLETAQPWILGNLQLLMTMWTSVLIELELEYEDEKTGTVVRRDSLIWTPDTFNAEERISPSVERSRALCLADSVHVVDTRAYIREVCPTNLHSIDFKASQTLK